MLRAKAFDGMHLKMEGTAKIMLGMTDLALVRQGAIR